MTRKLTSYRIFIATPSGLQEERKVFRKVIAEYNECEAIHRGIYFEPVGWEIIFGGVGRPQSLINEEIDKCDYFILMLWDRWGSPPDARGTATYTSGTEEEYHVAMRCHADPKKPMRQLVVLFKAVDQRQLTDPGDQLKSVLAFKQKLETEKTLMFHTFDEMSELEQRLRAYLAHWVRTHENGHPTKKPTNLPPLKPAVVDALHSPPKVAEAEEPRISALLAEAEKLAVAGKLIQAEAKFAEATVRGDSAVALNEYGKFLYNAGRLAQAETNFRRSVELAESEKLEECVGSGLGYLGLINHKRGLLTEAEHMYLKALQIEQRHGNVSGILANYSNLGVLYNKRGQWMQAQKMHNEVLRLCEQFGHRRGQALAYSNLGLVYWKLNRLPEAEAMHRKALDISQQLGDQEGLATAYRNLGMIYRMRGDLTQAERFHRKALEIDEQLGDRDALAKDSSHLGLVYMTRGEWTQAEQMHSKALRLHMEMDDPDGMAGDYTNLGFIYLIRGQLTEAEDLVRKSLEIDQRVGNKHEAAKNYRHLAFIYQKRGQSEKAQDFWIKAKELSDPSEASSSAASLRQGLDELDQLAKPILRRQRTAKNPRPTRQQRFPNA